MSASTVSRTRAAAPRYRWTIENFLAAEAAGVFGQRVELVDGEVWTVGIGRWHGRAGLRCARLLDEAGVVVTQESLATGDSLPDPDVWVCPETATETGWLSPRISTWSPADVLLVVEISDETVAEDLSTKATLYGSAGYAVYWVVTREAVHVHSEPDAGGYRSVVRYQAGQQVTLPYGDRTVDVTELLG